MTVEEIKSEAEQLAEEYEKHDIVRYGLLEQIIELAGLINEYPSIIETESDIGKRIALGVKAGELLGVHITDNHIDTLHTFCADCGLVIPENEMCWSYHDEDGYIYCRHCKHKHMIEGEDQHMLQTIITTVTCQQCGKQFTAGKYTRFCHDCRKARALAHQRGVCRRRKQRFRRKIGSVYACID